ncbi:hypothetical protein SFRURICE_000928, partial [Spodoptera frugiperda]
MWIAQRFASCGNRTHYTLYGSLLPSHCASAKLFKKCLTRNNNLCVAPCGIRTRYTSQGNQLSSHRANCVGNDTKICIIFLHNIKQFVVNICICQCPNVFYSRCKAITSLHNKIRNFSMLNNILQSMDLLYKQAGRSSKEVYQKRAADCIAGYRGSCSISRSRNGV